jgi:hypothetical protein
MKSVRSGFTSVFPYTPPEVTGVKLLPAATTVGFVVSTVCETGSQFEM